MVAQSKSKPPLVEQSNSEAPIDLPPAQPGQQRHEPLPVPAEEALDEQVTVWSPLWQTVPLPEAAPGRGGLFEGVVGLSFVIS